MSIHPSVGERARGYIDEVRSIDGVIGCALVSQDGSVMEKYFQEEDISSSLFAAMSATVLASAEAAASSIHIPSPSSVTIATDNATILVMGLGEETLITAVVERSADFRAVRDRLAAIAAKIGGRCDVHDSGR